MRSAADCCVRGRFSCCTTDGAHRQWPSGRQSNVWHSNVRQFCGCTVSCCYTGTHSRHVKPCGDVANQQARASLKCSRNSLHLDYFLPLLLLSHFIYTIGFLVYLTQSRPSGTCDGDRHSNTLHGKACAIQRSTATPVHRWVQRWLAEGVCARPASSCRIVPDCTEQSRAVYTLRQRCYACSFFQRCATHVLSFQLQLQHQRFGSRGGPGWASLMPGIANASEDCLFINILAPLQPAVPGPLPVMLYLHAGEFRYGTSNDAESNFPYFVSVGVSLNTCSIGKLPFLTTRAAFSRPLPRLF